MSHSQNIYPGSAHPVQRSVITRAADDKDRPAGAEGGASSTGASTEHHGLQGSPKITMASAGNGSDDVNNLTDGLSGMELKTQKPIQERQQSHSLPADPGAKSQVGRTSQNRVNVFDVEEESPHDDRPQTVDKPCSEDSHKTDKFSHKTPEAAEDSGSVQHKASIMDSVEDRTLDDVKHLPLIDSDTEAEDMHVKAVFEAEVLDSSQKVKFRAKGSRSLKLDAYQWQYLTSEKHLWNRVEKAMGQEHLMASIVNISEPEHNHVIVSFRRNREKHFHLMNLMSG
ncbi:uncharacterized protein LOC124265413 [Haliotis rubra]|uniref:uncharacterized protein LOC124265413 n=1 Tax=Haliotis rubra TaxID=36100 RepID=UPI001EE5E264|nr:uncharacterized protein LOC124265413 [Haliotis rubra]